MSTASPQQRRAERAMRARAARLGRARAMLVLAAVVLALLLWGRANPAGSLPVHDLLDHPVVLGLAAWGLLAAGVAGHVEDPQRRIVAAVLLGGTGVTIFALSGLVISAQVSRERTQETLTSPDGRRVAVVDDDGETGNPAHRVVRVVVQDASWSLGAHRFEVACVQATTPARRVTAVAWDGAARLRLTTAGGAVVPVSLAADGAGAPAVREGLLCTR